MDIQTIQQSNKWTTATTTTVDLTSETFLFWYLTSMDWGKGVKGHATTSRYTSEGLTPSKPF